MGSLLRVLSRYAKAAAGAKSSSLIAWAAAILVLGAVIVLGLEQPEERRA